MGSDQGKTALHVLPKLASACECVNQCNAFKTELTDKMRPHERSPKIKPKHLDRPLAAGFRKKER